MTTPDLSNVRAPAVQKPHWIRRRRTALVCVAILATISGGLLWRRGPRPDADYRTECRKLSDDSAWGELRLLASEWSEVSVMPDEAYLYLAESQLESGEPLLALETLLKVPAKSPRSFAALITACNLQFGDLNRPLDGVETLKLMIQRKPSSISSHQRLIFFYAVTLQRNLMLAAIDDAIKAQAEPPDAYVYLMLSDHLSFTNGFTKNSEWLRSDPDSEVFQTARIVQLIENVEAAESPTAKAALGKYLETFEELLQKFPQNTVLLRFAIERAVVQFDVEKVGRFVKQLPPGNRDSVLLRQRAWLKFQLDAFDECQELLNQSLSENALDWHTWHELSVCRRRLGEIDGAKQASKIALVGKALRKGLLQMEDASAITGDTLEQFARYAESCGDTRVSSAILTRLHSLGQVPN